MAIRQVSAHLIATHVGRPQLPGHQHEYITVAFHNEESGQDYLIRLTLGCPLCAEKKGELPQAGFTLLAGGLGDVMEAHIGFCFQSSLVTRSVTGQEEVTEVYVPYKDE
jgi:hypothetical protein